MAKRARLSSGAECTPSEAGPPGEVVAVTTGPRYVRLVAPHASVIDTVTRLLKHVEAAGLEVLEVKTAARSVLLCSPEVPLYFSNICGKIEHYDVCKVTKDAVAPYVVAQSDSFGRALGVFSKHCSLRISKAMTNTLFRGGSSSAEIAEVIDHAILPETIRQITVHMIVASARLGRPVLMQEDFFIHRLQALPHWHCQRHVTDEEMQKYYSLQLTRFDADWLLQMGVPPGSRPQSCLLNVCRTGTINLFVSVAPGVRFFVGIEHTYTRMLEEVLAVVRRFT